ncbi:hypothetical protein MMC20_007200 [Loxospora ochrophaea]|nr:hypothetical protein [Loxospora ochrophaea]
MSPKSNNAASSRSSKYQDDRGTEKPRTTKNGTQPSTSRQQLLQSSSNVSSNAQNSRQYEPGAYQDSRASGFSWGAVGNQSATCPYHGAAVAQTAYAYDQQARGLSPMDRFLAEDPSQQSAMFVRPDTGRPSTSRVCTCYAATHEESRQRR